METEVLNDADDGLHILNSPIPKNDISDTDIAPGSNCKDNFYISIAAPRRIRKKYL